MSKFIRIFKSFGEQEQYHKDLMRQSTVEMRFRKLKQMQEFQRLLLPDGDRPRIYKFRMEGFQNSK